MVAVNDDASIFVSLFALVADTETDKYNLITLHDIKKNLKNYSLSKLKSLALMLIDSLDDLAKGKEYIRED